MLRDACCLAQGVALQAEEDQPRAGGKRLERCGLLDALGRRVKENEAGSLCAPVYPSLFSLKTSGCCLAGILHTSLEGIRL